MGHAALFRRLARCAAPDVVVVYDVNPREVAAGVLLRLRGVPAIVEVGDIAAELLAAGGAGRPHVAYRAAIERSAWRAADMIAVRGEGFVPLLRERGVRTPIEVVPEGVDPRAFGRADPAPWRRRLGMTADELAVGVVGSIVWNPLTQVAYGWELVDALVHLPGRWKAVIVGDGDGLDLLRGRARGAGVSDRLVTPGWVERSEVPGVLAALDAVTWTQTPDAVGSGRTTAKLPEYLAAGKFIVASDVGQARISVRGNGVRLPYGGGRDAEYARAVAATLDEAGSREALARSGAAGIALAAPFHWDRVAARFCDAVERLVGL
jgi:glycosyltransferase involved in cell wall biosynthesis